MSKLLTNAGNWQDLNLRPQLLKSITDLYESMTPVQRATIPLFQSHKDVVVEAVTGSGKTLAFVVPLIDLLLQRLERNELKRKVYALILSPTRELANQIFNVLNQLLNTTESKITCILFTGGHDIAVDLKKYCESGGNIVVGTVGRINELFKRESVFDLRELDMLILDEADRLLDNGFETKLLEILKRLPKQRRTGLFSATMSEACNNLIKAGLRNPYKVTIQVKGVENIEQKYPETLNMKYMIVSAHEKLFKLLQILLCKKAKTIVYFNTGACVDFYYKVIDSLKLPIKVLSLHGKMVTKRRELLYRKFSNTPASVLLTTDVAARGIDIPDIELVIQFDPPQDPAQFSHRCGRTARNGKSGTAIVMIMENEDTFIEFLKIRHIPITEYELEHDKTIVGNEITQSSESLYRFIRNLNKQDREHYDKSVQAFVSFIRSYKLHLANYIFNFKELDMKSLVRQFGLLQLPKMPELKEFKTELQSQKNQASDELAFVELDVDTIEYKDEKRELKRKNGVEPKKRKISKPWSKQKKKRASNKVS